MLPASHGAHLITGGGSSGMKMQPYPSQSAPCQSQPGIQEHSLGVVNIPLTRWAWGRHGLWLLPSRSCCLHFFGPSHGFMDIQGLTAPVTEANGPKREGIDVGGRWIRTVARGPLISGSRAVVAVPLSAGCFSDCSRGPAQPLCYRQGAQLPDLGCWMLMGGPKHSLWPKWAYFLLQIPSGELLRRSCSPLCLSLKECRSWPHTLSIQNLCLELCASGFSFVSP